MERLSVSTRKRREMVEITSLVAKTAKGSGVQEGCCLVFVPHTTCGLTINENADPSVSDDILRTLEKLVPARGDYRHTEGNSDAHVASTLVGHSVLVPIHKGNLVLCTWQGIFLCEFDGPRNRQVWIKMLPSIQDQPVEL